MAETLVKKVQQHGDKLVSGALGSGLTAVVIWAYSTFAAQREMDKTRADMQELREKIAVIEYQLKIP